ncbi:hypothetical protein J2S19_001452 [Metabacillus malikii]|uniref:Uncharacterized protein n=1 Tax=Metabacillus malikii TaxID=1504265 RepID=A0ABT9ZD53_9BACI|nr:hypothetical protein [Metabacillus malikii]
MKFVSSTLLIFFSSILIFFLFLSFFNGDDTGAMSIGIVLSLMLSVIITLLIRILDILKKK